LAGETVLVEVGCFNFSCFPSPLVETGVVEVGCFNFPCFPSLLVETGSVEVGCFDFSCFSSLLVEPGLVEVGCFDFSSSLLRFFFFLFKVFPCDCGSWVKSHFSPLVHLPSLKKMHFLAGDRDLRGDRDSLALLLPGRDLRGDRDLPVFRVLDLSFVLLMPWSLFLGNLPRWRPVPLDFGSLFGLGAELLFSSTTVMEGILAEFETCTRHMLT
jgi:hypothetical protein